MNMNESLDFKKISSLFLNIILIICDVIFRFVMLFGAISAILIAVNLYPSTMIDLLAVFLALSKLLITGLVIACILALLFKIGDVFQKLNIEAKQKAEIMKQEYWDSFKKYSEELKNARRRKNNNSATTRQSR